MSATHISLKPFNTFGLDAACQTLVEANSVSELLQYCLAFQKRQTPFIVLGGGSNLLLLENYQGAVIRIQLKGISVHEDSSFYYLTVAAGESWHGLVKYCLSHHMAGLENMALIPGTVGAAPIQNIGAYGLEFADVCEWVEYLELPGGDIKRLAASACEFDYRESIFKGELRDKAVITQVGLKLAKAWQPRLNYGPLQHLATDSVSPQQIFDAVCDVRRRKLPDPKVLGNVGSCFKNPIVSAAQYAQLHSEHGDIAAHPLPSGEVKIAAAWLIDKAGLKGKRFGGVGVHDGQPLVLVNHGDATGTDVALAVQSIRARVQSLFGIVLALEPRTYGAQGERRI
ncbi:UDP-N-acetylmuramate dehydrogenase [Shewanella sp. YIC-542]|uniref:UDP-N-acetylmuramate dehydrogenase n=1 Tax=Shewanella mytili TaxID=3377111 RepID=UPI00398E8EA7